MRLFVFLYLASDFEIIGELTFSLKSPSLPYYVAAGDIVVAILALCDN
jgi:hypothetical protein